MSLKKSLRSLGLLVGLAAAVPLFGQSQFSISCPSPVAPGTDVICTLSLAPAVGATVTGLAVGIQIAPNAGAPDLSQTGSVTWDGNCPTDINSCNGTSNLKKNGAGANLGPATSGGGYNSLAVSFNVTSGALTGFPVVGMFDWIVPANAQPNQSYALTFTNVLANNGATSLAVASTNFTESVQGVVAISSPAAGALVPQATAGTAYNQTFTATGGNGTYNWTINANSLPTGLNFTSANNQGKISGTPASTSVGAFNNIVITVTDTEGAPEMASNTYSLTVNAAMSTIGPAALGAGTANAAYSQTLSVTGGSPNYTWTATGLPAPLVIANPTVLGTTMITGTPTAAFTGPVTVTVVDANGATQQSNYTLTINGPLTITTPAGALPTGNVGVAYPEAGQNSTLAASGGAGGYTWTVAGSSANPLPAGLSITTNASGQGVISGTPSAANGPGYSVTFQVKDAANATTTQTYTIGINPALTITNPPASLPNGTQGAPYPPAAQVITFTAGGGSGSYTWSIAPSNLGITIGSTTGTIGGSPNASGTDSFTITVTDANFPAVTATKTYNNVVIAAGVTITAPAAGALPNATVNVAYSQTINSAGGTGPYTWALAAGSNPLPTGLGIAAAANTANGVISGTPTVANAPGGVSVTVQVTDNTGSVSTRAYTVTVYAAPNLTSNAALTVATVGAAYTDTGAFSETGGAPPLVYTTLQALPSNLSISSTTGVITGTPAAGTNTNTGPGTANTPITINIKVTDANGVTSIASPTLTINPALTITTASPLPAATLNGPYSTTVVAAGGGGGYSFTATGLPAGLTISAGGVISGTPTTNVGSPFTAAVTVTDVNSVQTKANLSLTVNAALTITTTSPLPAGTNGAKYTTTFVASGGTGALVWSTTSTPPTGLSLSSAGVLSGTPTVTGGPTSLSITVTDANMATNNGTFNITINAAPTLTSAAALPVATVGAAYSSGAAFLTEGAGVAPFTYSTVQALPAGLTIAAATGVISGTPAAGTATNAGLGTPNTPVTVNIKVTDANGATATDSPTLTINPALTITTAALPVGIPGVAYTTTVAASGGSGTYTWGATGLPAGLSIAAATGAITGSPSTNTGSPFSVKFTVTDSNNVSTSLTLPLAVAPPLSVSTTTLPSATLGSNYSATLAASGGTAPYTWAATGLPTGLSINTATGVISGSPTTVVGSPFIIAVTVTDANKTTAHMNLSLAVGSTALQIITGLLPSGVVGVPYQSTFIQVQGGAGNYSFNITGLPPGLTTDGQGTISGTPTSTTGSPFKVVVTVTDAAANTVTRNFTVTINNPVSITGPATLPMATLNAAYTPTMMTTAGGLPPYTWTATGLPTGLSIGFTTGIIAGTPTVASGSPYAVVVTVMDSTTKTATMNYSLVVNAPLTITGPASLPAGIAGTAYTSTTVTASGGAQPYTWSASGLPSGLSINSSTGAISGTPAANATGTGTFAVTVTVTDNNKVTASQNYTLIVNPGQSGTPVISSIITVAGPGVALTSPNTWMQVNGSNFAPPNFTDIWTNAVTANKGNLPTTLDNVSVMVGGVAAYIEYVSSGQINILTGNIGFGPLQVTVTVGTQTTAAFTINSQAEEPGFFPWPNNQAVATHLDYSDACAPNTFAAAPNTVPAKPGENIILWGSGFGPTTPAFPFGVGVPSTATYSTTNNVTVMLNNAPISVYNNNATLIATDAGTFAVGVTIPANLANGTYPITVTVGAVTSPTLMLTVHN